jgi:xanthosine utilization system XapX-like protein
MNLKLIFGAFGAVLLMGFLASFVIKVKEPSMIIVTLMGVAMMLVDVWQARDEADT